MDHDEFNLEDGSHQKIVDDTVFEELNLIQKADTTYYELMDKLSDNYLRDQANFSRPITLLVDAPERVLPQDLVILESTEGCEDIQKLLMVLIYLCDEATDLKDSAKTRLFGPLLMFGTQPINLDFSEDEALKPGQKEQMIGTFLPLLVELNNFVDRVYEVAVNLVQQLASALAQDSSVYRPILRDNTLPRGFQALNDLMGVLISLDSIVSGNEILTESWSHFKFIVGHARDTPSVYDSTAEEVEKYERMLVSIDQSLMKGEIFRGCIDQNFEVVVDNQEEADSSKRFGHNAKMNVPIRNNTIFLGAMRENIRHSTERGLHPETFDETEVIGAYGMYALYRRLVPRSEKPDTKLYRWLWSHQKSFPGVIVGEKDFWDLPAFLEREAGMPLEKLDPPNAVVARSAYLDALEADFVLKAQRQCSLIKAWLVQMEEKLQQCRKLEDPRSMNSKLEKEFELLLYGISCTHRAHYMAKSYLGIHLHEGKPLRAKQLAAICQLLEAVKGCKAAFVRKQSILVEALQHQQRNFTDTLVRCVGVYKNTLYSLEDRDPARPKLLAVTEMFSKLLLGSDRLSPMRQAASLLMMDIIHTSSAAFMAKTMKSVNLGAITRKMCLLHETQRMVQDFCSTSFLYFHMVIAQPLIASVYSNGSGPSRLPYTIEAFADAVTMCTSLSHVEKTEIGPFLLSVRAFLVETIRQEVVVPLSVKIETDLRLNVHSKNFAEVIPQMGPRADREKAEAFLKRDELENKSALRPIISFLALEPIKLLGLKVDICTEVRHYLDTNFYNLTTVALYDWRTYSEMRALAYEKFGLVLMKNLLPMGSLDQGLDVLQIMRNIHVFVARFTYNLNLQQFIEFKPDKSSIHLNTINIESIAGSIRQHGLGVLNTTVNFTYQFLRSKFHIFSQFLFDQSIRKILSREHRWFKKNRKDPSVGNVYPYKRAQQVLLDIRALGTQKGRSALDKFRTLVTEIGNALGFVRMVRSAAMYYSAEAVQYLPDLDDLISFERCASGTQSDKSGPVYAPRKANLPDVEIDEYERGEPLQDWAGFSEQTRRAARNCDGVVDSLVKNFAEGGNDFFKILVNTFQEVLLQDEHEHLNEFYIIIPALCLSWMDASLLAKDAMYRVTNTRSNVTGKEVYFTDDGFPMGVAYCLAIMKQVRRHDALHWAEGVRSNFKHERRRVEKESARLQAVNAEKEKARQEKAAVLAAEEKKKRGWFGGSKKETKQSTVMEEEEADDDFNEGQAESDLKTSAKRLEAQKRCMEQLFFSMESSAIFFRR
jgi:WASH complex subunit 7